jgi:hypothetical protein
VNVGDRAGGWQNSKLEATLPEPHHDCPLVEKRLNPAGHPHVVLNSSLRRQGPHAVDIVSAHAPPKSRHRLPFATKSSLQCAVQTPLVHELEPFEGVGQLVAHAPQCIGSVPSSTSHPSEAMSPLQSA